MSKISELTVQQETAIDIYLEKWRKIAFSTQPIEREKASLAVEAVHRKLLRTEEFELYFFDSPLAIHKLDFLSYIQPTANSLSPKKLDNVIRKVEKQLTGSLLKNQFYRCISSPLFNMIGYQIDIQLWHYLCQRFSLRSFEEAIYPSLWNTAKTSPVWQVAKPNQQRRLEQLYLYLNLGLVTPASECRRCSLFEYCISELNCSPDWELWNILKTFVVECGWTFFFQDFCFICNRPCKYLLNEKNQPHAENEPAIQFLDGFSIFAYEGIPKY